MDANWLNDEQVKKIAPEKLEYIMELAKMCEGKSPKQLLPILMMASKKSKQNNIQLSGEELNLLIQVVRSYSSPEETAKMDMMLKKVQEKNGQEGTL